MRRKSFEAYSYSDQSPRCLASSPLLPWSFPISSGVEIISGCNRGRRRRRRRRRRRKKRRSNRKKKERKKEAKKRSGHGKKQKGKERASSIRGTVGREARNKQNGLLSGAYNVARVTHVVSHCTFLVHLRERRLPPRSLNKHTRSRFHSPRRTV